MKVSDNYLADLLERMDSHGIPDDGAERETPDQSIGWYAHREIEQLRELSLLPELEQHVNRTRKVDDFRKLSKILCELIRNTESQEARELYLRLLERNPTAHIAIKYLIENATRAGLHECRDYVLQHSDSTKAVVVGQVIEYLGELGEPEDIHVLGRLLDTDCNQTGWEPPFAIYSMRKLGLTATARPYLERAIQRHRGGRKRVQRDTVKLAGDAIKALDEST